MEERPRQPARGWRIDLEAPRRVLPADGRAALALVAELIASLRDRTPTAEDRQRVVTALRSAARLGADEHDLAVAAGLPLDAVRTLLRGGADGPTCGSSTGAGR